MHIIFPTDTSVTVLPPKPEKTLDLEAEGTINGEGVYSFDLESVQEKPWNKPGRCLIFAVVMVISRIL